MKRKLVISLLVTALFCAGAAAQNVDLSKLIPPKAPEGGGFMNYIIEDGDTIYVAEIDPTWVFPKGSRPKGKEWRKFYRLVYNFNKVYPYTDVAVKLCQEADSTIAANHFNKIQKDRYITSVQNQMIKDFTSVVRHMTISQGQLLCRLVDRTIGKSTYKIIKDYKNGLTAGFWQGVGKLFGQDMKAQYDPEGADKMTEELIKKWESGEFDALYYSIFMEWPKKTEVPEKYR